MNTLHHFAKTFGRIVIAGLMSVSAVCAQSDSTALLPDSIHPFHRKSGDVLNFLVVDNFYNPALAGSLKSYQAQASYGNTLPGSPNNRHYGNIMLDMFFGKKQGRHGLAYRMSMGHIGFSTTIGQRIDYSFQCLNKKNYSLRLGVGAGFEMDQHVPNNLVFGDMIDTRYGFIFYTQEDLKNPTYNSSAFRVSRVLFNAGTQLRAYDLYVNLYMMMNIFTSTPTFSPGNNIYKAVGLNAFYNVHLKPMQIIPSIEFNYWTTQMYMVQGGVMLASNTSKGGGGGITYNNYNIFGVSGLFAWNDYLRIQAQVQFPFSDIRMSYPVSNFQLTVSYKINDLGKYE